eukprot:7430676-Prorocentrum_lima.AAC.1
MADAKAPRSAASSPPMRTDFSPLRFAIAMLPYARRSRSLNSASTDDTYVARPTRLWKSRIGTCFPMLCSI